MSSFDLPIPLSEIESVLAWVDNFKLSRPTKKINRDFSDAVLLAEILAVHYPKLVEMHNYPPRNSHALKLNNWMTLNRKVLKKLKLSLCTNTMEQLANSASGAIERVLVMVRDKIRRDEDLNKSIKEAEQNMSSGGSYYEACGEDGNILVVPVKTRLNGVLETIQQKVVNYDLYCTVKEELKDAKDSAELLKQKVEHLDNLLKLREERIEELQKQLERKQTRRKDTEALQNSLQVPFETIASPAVPNINDNINLVGKISAKSLDLKVKDYIYNSNKPESNKEVASKHSLQELVIENVNDTSNISTGKPSYVRCSVRDIEDNLNTKNFEGKDSVKSLNSKENLNVKPDKSFLLKQTDSKEKDRFVGIMRPTYEQPYEECNELDRIKSDVFKEIETVDDKAMDYEDFKDTEPNITTIEETIQKEVKDITKMEYNIQDVKS